MSSLGFEHTDIKPPRSCDTPCPSVAFTQFSGGFDELHALDAHDQGLCGLAVGVWGESTGAQFL
eukprot:6554515-Lingulodinium_polyedra.AAC.1